MKFKLPEDLAALSLEELSALLDEATAEARELAAKGDDEITAEETADFTALVEARNVIKAELDERATAEEQRAEALRAARAALAEIDAEDEAEDEAEEESEEDAPADEVVEEREVVTAAGAKRGGVAGARRRAPKPEAREDDEPTPSVLIAAAGIPDFEQGSQIADMEALTKAFLSRSRGFLGRPAPSGEIFERFAVAQIERPVNEFTLDATMSAQAQFDVIMAAASEQRLSGQAGNGLVAAGGWCAPSETLYTFCELEQVSGLISVPEITIKHGGVNFTKGPQLGDLLADPNFGFKQTEAQAEAGTAKVCFEIECPDFTDVRMDVLGYCIRAGILTASPGGWPELVRRFLNLAVIAHQRKMNADTIGRISTLIGAATNFTEIGGVTADILDALSLQAWILRQKLFLNENATIEVILPVWAKEVIRADLARRTGVENYLSISDAQIQSLFAIRNLAVQYVNDYQNLPTTGGTLGQAWPTSLEAMLYPAGSFVRGASPVISLDTVYDSPLLATNTYTAAFFEEGTMVFNPCGEGRKVTIDISCLKGVTGAAELSCVTP